MSQFTSVAASFYQYDIDSIVSYDAKATSLNTTTVIINCPDLRLDLTMTKALAVRYLLGESWFITPARTYFELVLLQAFEADK